MIYSSDGAWGSAIRAHVYNSQSIAFCLWYAGQDRFFASAEGWMWAQKGGYFGSDLKMKKNIQSISSPMQKIMQLNGIHFDYLNDSERMDPKISNNSELKEIARYQRLGFVAQDVEKVLPGIVKTMPDSTKAIAYMDLTALLVEAIKEQQQIIDAQGFKIKELENKLTVIEYPNEVIVRPIATDKLDITEETTALNENNMFLYQNIPNPFTENTEIRYFLPENAQNARLFIFNMQGQNVKIVELKAQGMGSITIKGAELAPGTYTYMLHVNGKELAAKRMILTK